MDTSIDNLIKSISDSVKKKDEEIANLKLNIKNLETDLETCEDRIKKSEYENRALKEKIKELESSNNACAQFFEEVFGKLPQEFSVDDFKMSIDKRIKIAYDNGFREAQGKYNRKEPQHMYTIEQIVTEIFGSNPEIKTFDDMRYIIEQNRSEAYNKGLKTGKEVIFGNIYKYIVKEFNK